MPTDWLSIISTDEPLYDEYFARSTDRFAYENNWAFIAQETRFGGFRYLQNDLLLTAVSRHAASPFLFIFPPLGSLSTFVSGAKHMASELLATTGRRIVFRKLLPHLTKQLAGTKAFAVLHHNAFTHPRDIPEDIFPQVIISVDETLALTTSRFVKTRNQIKSFSDAWPTAEARDITAQSHKEIAVLAHEWTKAYHDRLAAVSPGHASVTTVDISAYTIFAEAFGTRVDGARYFGKVLCIGAHPIGFTFAGKISSDAAALYCSLSLRRFRGAAEYLLTALLQTLSTSGIRYLNLGGSETAGLFAYKRKFAVTELRSAHDVEYVA